MVPTHSQLRSPAVVLDPETGGVGIIHCLGPVGVPIVCVERRWPPRLGHLSRFVKKTVFVRGKDPVGLVEALLRLGPELPERGVLFPSTDWQLEQLLEHYEELTKFYEVPVNPTLGARLFQKSWQYELAAATGVPTAAHRHFRAGENPEVSGLRFPLILKPVARTHSEGGTVFRLRVLETPAALEQALLEIAEKFPGRLFQLAENIPGDSSTLVTVGSYSDRTGRVLCSYTGRKLTQWPYTHGSASVAESVALPLEVVGYARSLVEEARIHGITQVEFKYDTRDGLYKLIEINGRTWSWIKLAAASGVNLPLIQYADLAAPQLLEKLLPAQQRNDRFFVFDYHVALNRSVDEQALIASLARVKEPVLAMWHPGEWRLWLAHRFWSGLKVLRTRWVSGNTEAGGNLRDAALRTAK